MKAKIDSKVEVVPVLLFLWEQQDKIYQCINNSSYIDAIATDVHHELYEWAVAVNEFIDDTRFDEFFESQQTITIGYLSTSTLVTWIHGLALSRIILGRDRMNSI